MYVHDNIHHCFNRPSDFWEIYDSGGSFIGHYEFHAFAIHPQIRGKSCIYLPHLWYRNGSVAANLWWLLASEVWDRRQGLYCGSEVFYLATSFCADESTFTVRGWVAWAIQTVRDRNLIQVRLTSAKKDLLIWQNVRSWSLLSKGGGMGYSRNVVDVNNQSANSNNCLMLCDWLFTITFRE